ncbi:transposase [Streptomyces sp. HUAS ZL42]|uniref:transposase n=1 Tax=Streptomyces sp. HUAS ZL42 TaxID=3231715 RepID=UPI00345E765F
MYVWSRTPTAVIVDSQALRAADTIGTDGQGRDGGKDVAGRTGHVAVGCPGRPLVVLVTAASVRERDAGIPLLTRLRPPHRRITLVRDDGGYAGQLLDRARKRTDHATGFAVQPQPPTAEATSTRSDPTPWDQRPPTARSSATSTQKHPIRRWAGPLQPRRPGDNAPRPQHTPLGEECARPSHPTGAYPAQIPAFPQEPVHTKSWILQSKAL